MWCAYAVVQTACEQRRVSFKNRTEEEKRWCSSSSPPVGCGLPVAVWCVKVCPRWRFKKMGWAGKWDHYTCLEDLVATHTTWLLPAGGDDSQYLVCVCVYLCKEGRNSLTCVQTPAVSVCLSPTFSSISVTELDPCEDLCMKHIFKSSSTQPFIGPVTFSFFYQAQIQTIFLFRLLKCEDHFFFDHSKLNMFVCWSQPKKKETPGK